MAKETIKALSNFDHKDMSDECELLNQRGPGTLNSSILNSLKVAQDKTGILVPLTT